MQYFKKFIGLVFLFASFSFANAAQTKPDVRLLLDVSGSMAINDPEKLRIPSVQLLVNLLPNDAKAGIWTFGTNIKNIAKFANVNKNWKNAATSNLNAKITSKDLYTDIASALNSASFDRNSRPKNADSNIILLSDGKLDVSKSASKTQQNIENQKAKDKLLRQTLPKLVQAGYKIHTIALSEDADKDLLNTISQKSGGLFGIAKNADELLELFVKALQRSVPQEEVPIKKDSSFLIDNSITEFTVLAFHTQNSKTPVMLESPDGKRYKAGSDAKNMNWYATKNYDLITVKKPIGGDWKLLSKKDSANRVTVVSNLKMQSNDIPANVQRGRGLDVNVWFEQNSKLLTRQEFLNILTVYAELTDEQGRIIDKINLTKPQKGVNFKGNLNNINAIGDLTLVLQADAKTFSRTLRKSLRVQDLINAYLQQGDGFAKLILRTEFKNINPNKLQINVSVGDKKFIPQYRGDGEWQADLTSAISSSQQTVRVNVSGELVDKNLNLVLGNMTLNAQKPVEKPVEFVPEKPEIIAEKPLASDLTNKQATPQITETANLNQNFTPNIEATDVLPNLDLSESSGVVGGEKIIEDNANAQQQNASDANLNQPTKDASIDASQTQEKQELDLQIPAEQPQTPQADATQNQAQDTPEAVDSASDLQAADTQDSALAKTQAEKDRLLWIYILVGLGNIVLFGIAYMIYRKLINNKKDEILNS